MEKKHKDRTKYRSKAINLYLKRKVGWMKNKREGRTVLNLSHLSLSSFIASNQNVVEICLWIKENNFRSVFGVWNLGFLFLFTPTFHLFKRFINKQTTHLAIFLLNPTNFTSMVRIIHHHNLSFLFFHHYISFLIVPGNWNSYITAQLHRYHLEEASTLL